jgi:peptidoglycan/LPS O-acetylase OafA/YrhL
MILPLQYLRGIAALMVVLFHIERLAQRFGYEGHLASWMFAGVDLFFVLSGFLMWAITAETDQSPQIFMSRRIARIVPLYWFMTTVVAAIMLFAPNLMVSSKFILSNVIGSYLFIGMPHSTGWLLPALTVGWTLNMEMLFYVIFAFSLTLPRTTRGIAISATLLLLMAAGTILPKNNLWVTQYTSTILLEFIFGIAIAEIYRRGGFRQVRPLACWALIGAGVVGFILFATESPFSRGITAGIPAAIMFVGFLGFDANKEARPIPLLKFIGDASYSLYLIHILVLSFAFQFWRAIGGDKLPAGLLLFVVFSLALCIGAAAICYRLVELPLTTHVQKLVSARWPQRRPQIA